MTASKLDDDISSYFDSKARVHDGFGYTPDWVEIPMDDLRTYYWMLVGGEGHGGACVYSKEPFTESSIAEGKTVYSGPIYTQRFLPKWVYRAETHVMVAVNTQTDNNRFLMIFDVSRECTDEALRETWREHWG